LLGACPGLLLPLDALQLFVFTIELNGNKTDESLTGQQMSEAIYIEEQKILKLIQLDTVEY
jgi:hypothetical protein